MSKILGAVPYLLSSTCEITTLGAPPYSRCLGYAPHMRDRSAPDCAFAALFQLGTRQRRAEPRNRHVTSNRSFPGKIGAHGVELFMIQVCFAVPESHLLSR